MSESSIRSAIVGASPTHIAVNDNSQLAYVSNQSDNTVSVVKFPTVYTIRHDSFNVPTAVGYNPLNGLIYVANIGGPWPSPYCNTVSVIDGENVIRTITVGEYPSGIAYNPYDKNMYVTDVSSNTVSLISDAAVVDTINVGREPWGVAYYGAEQKMLVSTGVQMTSI